MVFQNRRLGIHQFLYLLIDGEIPGHVFRNILQEYKDDVCIADFTCYKKEKQEGEGK